MTDMDTKPLAFLPGYFSSKAIITYVIVLVACMLFFPSKVLPIHWIAFGIIEVISFFYFSKIFTQKWANLKSEVFKQELFQTAFLIRLVYVVFIYFFYDAMTGKPFEFEGLDSFGYHNEGIMIVDWIYSGRFLTYFQGKDAVSDTGFPLWLTIIYLFSFKSIMVARIVNALMDAWMCVLLYKLTFRNFGIEAARISAIFAMLLPTLIYYSGLHDKETVMGFFLVAFIERADFFIRLKTFKTWNLLTVVFLGGTLFFFRTVLAVAAWFAMLSALLFSTERIIGVARRAIYLTWFSLALIVLISSKIGPEIEIYMRDRKTNQQQQMLNYSTNKGANKLAKYGTASLFIPIILFAPFPTMVFIEDQPNAMMMNGNLFTRNIYSFFVVIALLVMIKKKLLAQHVLILTLPITYLAILSLSGFALSERFHMPAIPFLLVLAGYGVTMMDKYKAKYYVPFLIIIGVVILGWNFFKLAGRGSII
jgi:hypothetical protein